MQLESGLDNFSPRSYNYTKEIRFNMLSKVLSHKNYHNNIRKL
jgi:hypothetical protein